MAPSSYRGPSKTDPGQNKTYSQAVPAGEVGHRASTIVSMILEEKGSDVFSVGPDATIRKVAEELSERGIGVLVITDDAGGVLGIVSERDIVHHLQRSGNGGLGDTVDRIMTRDPQSCRPVDTMRDIMEKMTAGRFRHMPVVKDGKLAGLISISDVVRHRVLELEYENLKMKQAIVG